MKEWVKKNPLETIAILIFLFFIILFIFPRLSSFIDQLAEKRWEFTPEEAENLIRKHAPCPSCKIGSGTSEQEYAAANYIRITYANPKSSSYSPKYTFHYFNYDCTRVFQCFGNELWTMKCPKDDINHENCTKDFLVQINAPQCITHMDNPSYAPPVGTFTLDEYWGGSSLHVWLFVMTTKGMLVYDPYSGKYVGTFDELMDEMHTHGCRYIRQSPWSIMKA